MQNGDGAKDDFGTVEHETHATVLDKLLAWEKKLYDEVKVRQNISVVSILVQFLNLCLFIMVILLVFEVLLSCVSISTFLVLSTYP